MGTIHALVLKAMTRAFPADMLISERYFTANLVLIGFFLGLLSALPLAFALKRAGRWLRRTWQELRRNRRLAQVKVPNAELIGEVTNYLSRAKVAIIKVRNHGLSLGDTILIKGRATKLLLPVRSMQIDHAPVRQAKRGSEIGLLTGKPVSRKDLVFRMRGQR